MICKFLTAAAFPKVPQTVFDNALKTTYTRFRTCLDVTRTRAGNSSQQQINTKNSICHRSGKKYLDHPVDQCVSGMSRDGKCSFRTVATLLQDVQEKPYTVFFRIYVVFLGSFPITNQTEQIQKSRTWGEMKCVLAMSK